MLMPVMFLQAAETKGMRGSKYRVPTTVEEKGGLTIVMRACGKRTWLLEYLQMKKTYFPRWQAHMYTSAKADGHRVTLDPTIWRLVGSCLAPNWGTCSR
jgi:hypothetical protein